MKTLTTLIYVLAVANRTARETFKEKGEVHPMWCGHTVLNELVMVLPEQFRNADDKDKAVAAVRRIFKEKEVVAFSFMCEAWILESRTASPEAFKRGMNIGRNESLEHNPDRREVIQVVAEDRESTISGHYFILRPEHGKPTLSPFHRHDFGSTTGRMTNLLRDDYVPTERAGRAIDTAPAKGKS